MRTVRTASGARAVQIVCVSRRGSRTIEHVGSAHDEAELEALKAAARQRLAGGHCELDLELSASIGIGDRWSCHRARPTRPLEITSSRMGPLWDALGADYD